MRPEAEYKFKIPLHQETEKPHQLSDDQSRNIRVFKRWLIASIHGWQSGFYLQAEVFEEFGLDYFQGTRKACDFIVYDKDCSLEIRVLMVNVQQLPAKFAADNVDLIVQKTCRKLFERYYPAYIEWATRAGVEIGERVSHEKTAQTVYLKKYVKTNDALVELIAELEKKDPSVV